MIIAGLLGLVVIVGAVALLSSGPVEEQAQKSPQALEDEEEKAAQLADELLDNAWSMLQTDRFLLTSDLPPIAALLNEWLTLRGGIDAGTELSTADRKTLERLLPAEELSFVEQPRFTPRDADHIGACLIEKAVAEQVTAGVEGDLEQVLALFNYACRNIALLDPESHIVSGRFQTLLLGRGAAEDRAHLFANLLRQLQIDSMILRPAASESGDEPNEAHWLIGVLLNEEVYLFDPHLGWPVPSLEDDPNSVTAMLPATLADAMNDDAVLRQLDLSQEHRHPLSSATLRDPRVLLIGSSSCWSPIMKKLQMSLTGDRAVVVYDGLLDDGQVAGLLTRVARFAGTQWNPEDTSLWAYPAQQAGAATDTESADAKESARRMQRFEIPLERLVDLQQLTVQFGPPQHSLWKSRVTQLLGDYVSATTVFQAIRIDGDLPVQFKVNEDIRRMHAEGIDDATYWVGLCQYELGEFRSARETLRNYLSVRVSVGGAWVDNARELFAICLAREGRLAEATLHMTELDDDLPRHRGPRLLLSRWRNMLETEETDAETEQGE